jgi:phage recombination protein Bet
MSNPTTALATLPDCIAARGIDSATYSALSNSIFPGAMPESIAIAFDYCIARKLDPMKKPCHIVPMNVKNAKTGNYEWRDVIMPGIAEIRITADRTGKYAGQDAPVFGPFVEMVFGKQTHMVPDWCSVTVYRFMNGERVPFSHTEYFEEAANTLKDGTLNSMWTKRKRGQLAKCAEAGALRKAFPEESGGIITAEEEASENMRDVTNSVTVKESDIAPSFVPPSQQALPAPNPPQERVSAPEPAATPEPAPTAASRAAGYVENVENVEGDWIVTLKGSERTISALAATDAVGEKANRLVGFNCWVSIKKKDGSLVLTSIELKEEGGELL